MENVINWIETWLTGRTKCSSSWGDFFKLKISFEVGTTRIISRTYVILYLYQRLGSKLLTFAEDTSVFKTVQDGRNEKYKAI